MIQRCPECGQWCEVKKQGFLGKAMRGFEDSAAGGGRIGASIGGLFGKTGEKIGTLIGSAVAGATGLPYAAAAESLMGDAYHFVCPECGHDWSTDDPDDDQTEEYYVWLAVVGVIGTPIMSTLRTNKMIGITHKRLCRRRIW